jgi:hypothetical protein
MGYQDRLNAAAVWLQSIQRPLDGGWGLAAGQSSSIVNTAEALFVLRRARFLPEAVKRGLAFVRGNLDEHLADTERGRRVRYVAFALLAFLEFRDLISDAEVERCVTWLLYARNSDAGWGHEAHDGNSQLFTTAVTMWLLRTSGVAPSMLDASEQYVLGLAGEDGWSLERGQSSSEVANAFALLALGGRYDASRSVATARQTLLQTSQWGSVQESVPGTVWTHSTFAWVLPQLTRIVESPFAPVVADGIRYINSLACARGWSETPGRSDVSVRSQFWATMALSAVQDSFDPAKHALRVDAARAQENLPEPEFVKIAVHSTWATIMPAKAYRAAIVLLVTVALLILYGAHRGLSLLPHRADAVLSLAPLAVAYALVRKRPTLFPRIGRWAAGTLVALELFHLIFGISLTEIAETLQQLPTLFQKLIRRQ